MRSCFYKTLGVEIETETEAVASNTKAKALVSEPEAAAS